MYCIGCGQEHEDICPSVDRIQFISLGLLCQLDGLLDGPKVREYARRVYRNSSADMDDSPIDVFGLDKPKYQKQVFPRNSRTSVSTQKAVALLKESNEHWGAETTLAYAKKPGGTLLKDGSKLHYNNHSWFVVTY